MDCGVMYRITLQVLKKSLSSRANKNLSVY
jgi:hypothetical protein